MYISKKKKRRAGGQNKSFPGVDTSGKRVNAREEGMRVNIVDVFRVHIGK
jgi:hypothetical protein